MVTHEEVPGLLAELNAVREVLDGLESQLGTAATDQEVDRIWKAAIQAEGRAATLTGRYIDARPDDGRSDEERKADPGFDIVFAQAHGQRDRANKLFDRCRTRLYGR